MGGLKPAWLTIPSLIRLIAARFTLSRSPVPLPPRDSAKWRGPLRAFAWGVSATTSTILSPVLFVTYIGFGALAHDTHFSLAWALKSTLLVSAGPAQIIRISTLARRRPLCSRRSQ